MARDSLFGETIVWSGRPSGASGTPLVNKLAAAVAVGVSIVTLSFAVVIARELRVGVGGMLAFSAWSATLALVAWRLPSMWRARVEYLVTDSHVVWKRGPIRRTIDRSAISYACIRWSKSAPGLGDLVLVRAVPTGALRRTLSLILADVESPDRVLALIRGVTPASPPHEGEPLPLPQRLDEGERVVWTAVPLASPWTPRRAWTLGISLVVAIVSVHMIVRTIRPIRRVVGIHQVSHAMLGVFIGGIALAALIVIAIAIGLAYAACVRPVRLAHATRYFVTNKRVLIRRGDEELHLDRNRIAYVIDAPLGASTLHDVFLVLDGPRARALAPMGAFGGGDGGELVPVFASIDDAETVNAILHADEPALRAA